MIHVDDFVDDYTKSSRPERYARWWLHHARLSGVLKGQFREFLKDAKLFCDYKEKRYRVIGASRLGDVWLAENFNRPTGYDLRVDVDSCSNWGDKP
jgi:hypothetical protein